MKSGVWSALYTPFDHNGNVCESRLRELLEFQIERGIDGVYVCGNSGQGLYLSVAERQRVLEIVQSTIAGRIGIVAQVAAIAERDVNALIDHACALKVDGLSSLPPVYGSVSSDEIVAYYERLGRRSTLPVLIYYFPAKRGEIGKGVWSRLFQTPNLEGFKYTGFDFYTIQGIVNQTEGRWVYLSGQDKMSYQALTMGAVGSIGQNQNVVPELFKAVYTAFQAGDHKRAMHTQDAINRLLRLRDRYGSLEASKAILQYRGIDPGTLRGPVDRGLDEEKRRRLHGDLDALVAEDPALQLLSANASEPQAAAVR